MKYFSKQEVLTVPNLLTLLRIIIVAPLAIAILTRQYVVATILLIISALSDMFDGKIARHFNQHSHLGAILDPIADKLTLATVAICGAVIMPQILPFVIIMVVKEALMLIGGAVLLKKKLPVPEAKWYGKVATVVFYVCVIVFVVVDVLTHGINKTLALSLIIFTIIFMLYAFVRYAILFYNTVKNDKK